MAKKFGGIELGEAFGGYENHLFICEAKAIYPGA